MTIPSVAHTAEFQRVANLPRRVWATGDAEAIRAELTEILRTPGGSMQLKLPQALGLYEAGVQCGLFAPLGVGEGKTLLSLLLAVVLNARRPMLLLPGGLVEKTQRERAKLALHWRIPGSLRVFSYDMLGRVQAATELETYRPDAIICDEVHRLKNKRAAVTRRVARYMHQYPETKFCGLSGTIMDKSLKDFAHILIWALKLQAPVPTTTEEIEEWAEALDMGVDPLARRKAGALLEWCTPEDRAEGNDAAARHGFRRRLTETPGVVSTIGEGEHVDCSIYLRAIKHPVEPVTEANFLKLRKEWATPDDWPLSSGADVWRHAQELALGLFYVWEPRPPEEWRDARRDWASFVRDTISRGRTFDSELHVANAIDAGKLPDGKAKLERWRAVRPTYEPVVKPVWCDDSALKACADWMKSPGIVWTSHGFFAEALSKYTDTPYFGAKGLTKDGLYIEDAVKGTSVIASIDANREGKNLQKLWSRNLVVCPPPSAAWLEQLIGRTHRAGQEADEVIVDMLLGCRENYDALQNEIRGAWAIQQTTGKTQKVLLADITIPTEAEIDALRPPRWTR